MEHRKRLAKRHMGDLHFGQSHSAAPIWELANMVDLSQWQWKPPTSPNTRRRQIASATEVRIYSDNVLNPLRSFFPQRIEQAVDLHKPDDDAQLPNDIVLTSVTNEPAASWGPDSTPADIINVALNSLSRDILDNTYATLLFRSFCDDWTNALAEKWFHGETVCKILAGITDGLNGEALGVFGSESIEQKKLLLIESTIEGISKGETDGNMRFDHIAWNDILSGVSKIQMNTIRVFARAMACIPNQHLKAVASGIIDNLYSYLDALGRTTRRPTLARQAAKMAVPLKALGHPELRFILDDATQRLLQYDGIDGSRFSDIRLGWLQLLARLPGVDETYLGQACVALEAGKHVQPMSELEVCQVLLIWANSRAPLEQYTKVYNTLNPHGTKCYRMLAARLWHTNQFHRVRPFTNLLHTIGRENAITLLAKGVSNPHRKGACSLANMALGMRRPRVAVEILCLYEESQKCRSSFWESRFGFRALESLVWVPGFDHKRLLALLGVTPAPRTRTRLGKARCTLSSNHIAKIAAVGAVVGLSPHLSRRKAFFFMTNCYRHLRRHHSRLRAALIRALFHNVTRCLMNGELGITSRLQYALSIIQKEMGNAAAQHIGLALYKRRRANIRLKMEQQFQGADHRFR